MSILVVRGLMVTRDQAKLLVLLQHPNLELAWFRSELRLDKVEAVDYLTPSSLDSYRFALAEFAQAPSAPLPFTTHEGFVKKHQKQSVLDLLVDLGPSTSEEPLREFFIQYFYEVFNKMYDGDCSAVQLMSQVVYEHIIGRIQESGLAPVGNEHNHLVRELVDLFSEK